MYIYFFLSFIVNEMNSECEIVLHVLKCFFVCTYVCIQMFIQILDTIKKQTKQSTIDEALGSECLEAQADLIVRICM